MSAWRHTYEAGGFVRACGVQGVVRRVCSVRVACVRLHAHRVLPPAYFSQHTSRSLTTGILVCVLCMYLVSRCLTVLTAGCCGVAV